MLPGDRAIGTCGRCGGAVCVPSVWLGVVPPTPTCAGCGAIPREAHGPVMEMAGEAPRTWTSNHATFTNTTTGARRGVWPWL